jgi:hypothetical protein
MRSRALCKSISSDALFLPEIAYLVFETVMLENMTTGGHSGTCVEVSHAVGMKCCC